MSYSNTMRQEAGFSLVELMISVALGLMITLAISTLFLNTNRSNTQNSDFATMQENARFAVAQISEDLRHAGFVGNLQNPADVDVTGVTMPANTNCGSTSTYTLPFPGTLDFTDATKLVYFATGLSSANLTNIIAPCNTVNANADLPATDNTILLIKRTTTDGFAPTAILTLNHFYVYASGGSAVLAQYTSAGMTSPLAAPSTLVWEYSPRFYYLTKNDELYRNYFDGAAWQAEPVAEGIEKFDVEFGIDSDGDGAPNFYNDGATTAIDYTKVVSARVTVLARTTQADPDPSYKDKNKYTLGSVTYTPSATKLVYHRKIYTTTVSIPNLRNRVMTK